MLPAEQIMSFASLLWVSGKNSCLTSGIMSPQSSLSSGFALYVQTAFLLDFSKY